MDGAINWITTTKAHVRGADGRKSLKDTTCLLKPLKLALILIQSI